MEHKNWFDVSREGLRQLQEGKPKFFILRELVQNAWDEDIEECRVITGWCKGTADITVTDDSPNGFRDLADAFTLFAPTYKRADPSKRGRFNLGEKQVLALARFAQIKTTTGTVSFDDEGRHQSRQKTHAGSQVNLNVRMTKEEYEDMLGWVPYFLPPIGLRFFLNDSYIPHKEPLEIANVSALLTEMEDDKDGSLRRTRRAADIHIHEPAEVPYIYMPRKREIPDPEKAMLYEMGLPVCEIDCDYSVDVQQKVPLAADRDSVPPAYLTRLYAEVLNATYDRVQEKDSSNVWVREAAASKYVTPEAVRTIVERRYGDKVGVADPSDPR